MEGVGSSHNLRTSNPFLATSKNARRQYSTIFQKQSAQNQNSIDSE
jgi:hypothetical protein